VVGAQEFGVEVGDKIPTQIHLRMRDLAGSSCPEVESLQDFSDGEAVN
jgi:hypothetical protein